MKYRLLVVDIDGTIIGRDGSISAEDREALLKVRQQGIGVSLSTGRAAQSCLPIIERLALYSHKMKAQLSSSRLP